MGIMTIVIVTFMILTALLFAAMGTEVTIKVSTLLWLVLTSLITGALWMPLLLINLMHRIRK